MKGNVERKRRKVGDFEDRKKRDSRWRPRARGQVGLDHQAMFKALDACCGWTVLLVVVACLAWEVGRVGLAGSAHRRV